MKKTLLLIIVAVAVILLASKYNNQKEGVEEVKIMQTVPEPDPSNATFILDEGPVTLKNGESSIKYENSFLSVDTSLLDIKGYGDINNDQKNDTVTILTQTGGGSGMFFYIVAYVSGNVEYKGSNGIFIGDRISPKSLKISSGGVITLEYLDRKEDEPMAAEPTIATSRNFVYRSGLLEER